MGIKVHTKIYEWYKLKDAQKGTSSILYSRCQCTHTHTQRHTQTHRQKSPYTLFLCWRQNGLKHQVGKVLIQLLQNSQRPCQHVALTWILIYLPAIFHKVVYCGLQIIMLLSSECEVWNNICMYLWLKFYCFSSYIFHLLFQNHNFKVCAVEQKVCKSNSFLSFLHLSKNISLHLLLSDDKLYAPIEKEKPLETKIRITLNVWKDVVEDHYVRATHFLMDPNLQAN